MACPRCHRAAPNRPSTPHARFIRHFRAKLEGGGRAEVPACQATSEELQEEEHAYNAHRQRILLPLFLTQT